MAELTFGEPEFFSTSQIRDYCGNARNVLRPMFAELHVSAEELEAALKYVKSANPHMGGLDSRVRAKLVARHLHTAADAIVVAQTSVVKTYLAFRKHYVDELVAAGNRNHQRRQFQFDD
ncbi:plasmid transfer protein TraA [Umezawaea beigongshangensis]|uniref:plasmid transfer protein TraA n=1 Tax=Umezawaea beigongshangensis TaxID=2780383 RepID=UPI0018F1491F|nr:plasmid transfer protein TraA [Umezawaea beigongshangensis]